MPRGSFFLALCWVAASDGVVMSVSSSNIMEYQSVFGLLSPSCEFRLSAGLLAASPVALVGGSSPVILFAIVVEMSMLCSVFPSCATFIARVVAALLAISGLTCSCRVFWYWHLVVPEFVCICMLIVTSISLFWFGVAMGGRIVGSCCTGWLVALFQVVGSRSDSGRCACCPPCVVVSFDAWFVVPGWSFLGSGASGRLLVLFIPKFD